MSLILGITVALFLLTSAKTIVPILVGRAAADTVPFALDYVRVRALGIPFAMCMQIAQSAAIGAKESVSPLAAVVVQSVLNVILDWYVCMCVCVCVCACM
jgi:Na+-driven multidrug efflux pump